MTHSMLGFCRRVAKTRVESGGKDIFKNSQNSQMMVGIVQLDRNGAFQSALRDPMQAQSWKELEGQEIEVLVSSTKPF